MGAIHLCDGGSDLSIKDSNHDPQNKKAYAGRSRESFMTDQLKMNTKKPSIRQIDDKD